MNVKIILNSDEINNLQYPVVVECFNHGIKGRLSMHFDKALGRCEKERAWWWYKKFRKWHLETGTPELYSFKSETLIFLKKLITFCGEYNHGS